MKATIFHNPKCGTSRKTLEILRDSGCDVWIHEYLKTPPAREELKRLRHDALIEVDGGITDQTARTLSAADVLVAGSFVFGNDYKTAIRSLKDVKC